MASVDEKKTLRRVLAIDGSYRAGGMTDQAVAEAADALRAMGTVVEIVNLREYPIEFCSNCRQCALEPGEAPGRCVIDDGMRSLIERIENADALILAAPTNLGSVTALFKRFMERLMPYAYWPRERPWPRLRKRGARAKPALLISSSAAPAWMGRWFFSSRGQLAAAAKTVAARPVATLFTGHAAGPGESRLAEGSRRRAREMARRLVGG
jgi:NAD(P)H-dependent FMN reductase